MRQWKVLTHENLVYTQLFLDYLCDKDPSSVKFLDETGFQLSDSGHRVYGYSPVGEQCFDVQHYLSTTNITLTFLAGIMDWSTQILFKVRQILLNFWDFSPKHHKQLIQIP